MTPSSAPLCPYTSVFFYTFPLHHSQEPELKRGLRSINLSKMMEFLELGSPIAWQGANVLRLHQSQVLDLPPGSFMIIHHRVVQVPVNPSHLWGSSISETVKWTGSAEGPLKFLTYRRILNYGVISLLLRKFWMVRVKPNQMTFLVTCTLELPLCSGWKEMAEKQPCTELG